MRVYGSCIEPGGVELEDEWWTAPCPGCGKPARHGHVQLLEGSCINAYATRPAKERIGLDELHARWAERSAAEKEKLGELRETATGREMPIAPATAARATLFGIRQTETREAVNELGRMLRIGLASHVSEVRLAKVRPLMDGHEERRKLLATREPTGDKVLLRGRTTRRTARLEQALAQHIALGFDDARPIASVDRLLSILEAADLTPQQEQALVAVALTRDRVPASTVSRVRASRCWWGHCASQRNPAPGSSHWPRRHRQPPISGRVRASRPAPLPACLPGAVMGSPRPMSSF